MDGAVRPVRRRRRRTPWSRPATSPATDYDLTLKATKKSGAEGFLVAFGVKDTGNYYWWNLGGWNNTQGAVEKAVGGGKER